MNRSSISALFTFFGYIALYIQFMWLMIPFLPSIVKFLHNFETKETVEITPYILIPTDMTTTPQTSGVSYVALIFALVITLAVCALTAYILAKTPGKVNKLGESATRTSANFILPTITHHKKLSKKRRRELSNRLQLAIKAVVSLLMFTGLFFAQLVPQPFLSFPIVITVGLMLLPWASLWFLLAYSLSRHTRNT